MSLWIKHPRKNQPDTMLTLSVYAFLAVTFKFLLNGVSLNIGGKLLEFGTVDATIIGALLAPTLAAYTARKFKDSPDKRSKDD